MLLCAIFFFLKKCCTSIDNSSSIKTLGLSKKKRKSVKNKELHHLFPKVIHIPADLHRLHHELLLYFPNFDIYQQKERYICHVEGVDDIWIMMEFEEIFILKLLRQEILKLQRFMFALETLQVDKLNIKL